jgi:hypothetical protein
MRRRAGWLLLVVANVLFCGLLTLYRTTDAAPPQAKPPFANPVQQRAEMVNQLKEISVLLKEQNALLRSGKLTVVIRESEQ